jgi:hypothetical protein
MARTTKPPQFSFDDSLVILPKRQNPLTQTQRGNYEWSWLQADCYYIDGTGNIDPISDLLFNTDANFQFLVFGADVPQFALYCATEGGQSAYNTALKLWLTEATAFLTDVKAWGTAITPAPTPAFPTADLVVPAPPSPVPNICTTRTSFLIRPSALDAAWGVTSDAGQGALVSCLYANTDAEQTFVEGFPLEIVDLVCAQPELPLLLQLEHLIVTVGFESAVNHGLGHADATLTTQAYTPIILRKQDYSPAIRAAGNIIDKGVAGLFFVVGLWYESEGV